MPGGPINQKHFANLQEKDSIIQQLFQENQQLRQALQHREVFEHFLASALTGAVANANLTKEITDPTKLFDACAVIAYGTADAMVRFLTEKESARKKRVQEEMDKEEAEAKAKAEASGKEPEVQNPTGIPLIGPDGKVLPPTQKV